MERRSELFKLLMLFFLGVLSIRVFYISSVQGKELDEYVKKQNYSYIAVNNRHNITDRNGKLITGVNKTKYIVFFSTGDNSADFELSTKISGYVEENKYQIYNSVFKNKKAIFKLIPGVDDSTLNDLRNIKVIELSSRYASNSPAAALIGYVSGNDGVAGLEMVYNDILKKKNAFDFSVFKDSTKKIYGDIISKDNSSDIRLITTINLDFQKICDSVLEKSDLPSAVVLMDINNFQILAMSSYPTFNQQNIEEYLARKDGSLNNRCIQNYDMGSIFKIVVASVALENGYSKDDVIYNCEGYIDVYGQNFSCHNKFGHGEQSMADAFYNSCNPVFIDIGKRIGYTKILEMAKKFGFGKKILLPEKLGYSATKLPDENNYYFSDLANISIGQGELNCNVVQGALMSAVIANGGIFGFADSVIGLENSNGDIIEDYTSKYRERIISKKTANDLKQMMEATCIRGTGTTAQLDFVGAAGKTGSAQTGWMVDDKLYQHAWFTGFFPAENPKYSLCVLVENGKSGSEVAAPIFREIGNKIIKLTE